MHRVVIGVFFTLLISGCDSVSRSTPVAAPSAAPPTTSSNEIAAIRQELDELKAQVEELKTKQNQDDLDRLFKDFDRIAFLQPGDTGYSTVRYDLGVLTVQLADVTPYANGSKVSLRFGNPLASTINGLKATIEWGHTSENGSPDNATAKSKSFTFSESLRSGAWTTVPVVLDGIPPAELGFVRVKNVAHTGILLAK